MSAAPAIVQQTRDAASGQPGEETEVRQHMTTEDAKPNPAKSIKLPPNRQRLVEDVIDLYSMKPTVEKVSRYTPNCVYDDQFVYANGSINRFKMACQWYALTYLFKESRCESYEIIKNEPNLIQFKNEQTWVFLGINKEVTINAIVSLSLDAPTADSDFPLISYHKDQANDKDYSHEGIGFILKKAQADLVPKLMSREEVMFFKADDLPDKPVVEHGSGTNAPLKDL